MNEDTGQDSPEMTRIEERLRTERTAATGLELDQLKLRALSQARSATPVHRTKGQLMKSRFGLLLMIVLGLMMSSTGATLAISGSSVEGNAAGTQYRTDDGDEDVLGDTDEQGTNPSDDAGGSAPATEEGGSGSDPQAAAQTQVVSDNGEETLPFTGFLAIPLLIGGVALLGTGAVLRLKARE